MRKKMKVFDDAAQWCCCLSITLSRYIPSTFNLFRNKLDVISGISIVKVYLSHSLSNNFYLGDILPTIIFFHVFIFNGTAGLNYHFHMSIFNLLDVSRYAENVFTCLTTWRSIASLIWLQYFFFHFYYFMIVHGLYVE